MVFIEMYKLRIYYTIVYIAHYFNFYTTFYTYLNYNLITFLSTHCLTYLPFKGFLCVPGMYQLYMGFYLE